MTSLRTGASRQVPLTLRLSSPTTAEPGRPDLRWRAIRNPVGRGLVRLLLAVARPLVIWQRRIRDRDYLRQLPDYLLRDIGIDVEDARGEARKPFWRP